MKKNKLLIGLGSLMVINLPLLATISCNNEITNQASKVLTSKKGVFFSTVFFGSGTNINEAKEKIDNKWIFDNKNIIFENYELLTSPESITNVKANISGTTIVLSFAVGDKSFEFAIADFVNSDYQELRLTIKNNTVFDKKLFSAFNQIEDVHEAIKLINKDWLKTYKAVIFNNSHLITDNTSIEIKPNISGTFIIVQVIISGETYNFFISGFTNSIISGNNKETIVKSPLITNDSFKSIWAHEESYTNEQVKAFIESNKNTIFHNLHNETTISSTESVYKVAEGKIEVKVKLSGKVYNTEGQLVDADSNKEYKVELIGFKTTNLTTYLSSTELDIKEISELSSKKASEIINNIDSNNEELKSKIKDLIKNPTLGQEIQTTTDIQITTKTENANDGKGTLDLKVSIKNNKAWENGVKKESKEFDLKLTGFKIQAPTTIANFEIKDLKKDTFSKHYATPFGIWDSATAATTTEGETDEQANEKLLKTELEKHVKSIFNNEPEDVTIKEVKINKDYTIGSIQDGYDAAHGAVYIVVTLNKYYDENGKLVDITSGSTDENKGKFYFKVTGFKVDGNMTTYLDYGSLYDDPELNAINLREPSADAPASKQTSEETSSKISTIKASQWKGNISFIKQEIEKKLLLEPPASGSLPGFLPGSLIKNKVYGDDKWHEVASTYTATGEENWGIEIDANQQAIFDDAKGTLTLEVTFKNVWWKNGVFIKEHKEVIRFSGFNNWINDKIQLNEVTYNPYLQVVEEVKTEGTKEKIAVISNPKFGDVDFIEYLLFDFYQANISEIDQILKDDYHYSAEGDIELIPGEGLEVGTEVLKKVVQDVLGASIKFSILKSLGAYPTQQKSTTNGLDFLLGMNHTNYLAGLEKFEVVKSEAPAARDLSTLKNKIKVTNINWNENVGDTFNFTIEIIEETPEVETKNQNVQKFNFKLIGFLGANNTKIELPKSLTAEAVPTTDVNSNNDISKKDLFDMKWTTHQYSDSEGIKNPQFYGHYWYSLDIVIKDTVLTTSLIDTTTQRLYDEIKDNKLSDFYLHLEDTDVVAYDIVKDEAKKQLTVKFKHEKWSTISSLFDPKLAVKRKQAEELPQLYFHLAVSNLGSFDFTKIFVDNNTESGLTTETTTSIPPQFDETKFPVLERYSKSIFAAEFVKDNYDQYGSIKLKGYDLPIDIDQYDFWYKDEVSQGFKELDKSKANIVEKYEIQVEHEKVNVFVEIQFNLDGAEKLSKNPKLYVSLKNDQNNKHLIKF